MLPFVFRGLPFLLIDSSINVELLAPPRQLRKSEPDRAAHHPEMGNLLPLDVSIHQRRADTKKPGSGPHVHGIFKCATWRATGTFGNMVSKGGRHQRVALRRRVSAVAASRHVFVSMKVFHQGALL